MIKKYTKRITALMLLCCMCLSILSAAVWASELESVQSDGSEQSVTEEVVESGEEPSGSGDDSKVEEEGEESDAEESDENGIPQSDGDADKDAEGSEDNDSEMEAEESGTDVVGNGDDSDEEKEAEKDGKGASYEEPMIYPASNEVSPGTDVLSDGWYMIISGNDDNWVLDVNGWRGENGTNVELYHRNNTTNQRFFLRYLKNGFYSIQAQHSGKYVQKENENTDSNVHQWAGCDSNNAQWKLIKADNGYFYIEARNGGYLDNLNASVKEGNNIRVYDYNASNAQKWRFVSTNTTEYEKRTIADGWYTIESQTTEENLVLNIESFSQDNGGNVNVWTANKTENQQFYVEYHNDGYYSISPKHSWKYVSAFGSNNQSDNVVQSNEVNNNSLWCLESAENGYYFVRCKSGNYLDNSGNNSNPGNNVSLYYLHNGIGGPAQRWKFVPYNGEMPEAKTKGTYKGHTYEMYNLLMSWQEAENFCERKGGHLITITSDSENTFVRGLFLPGYGDYWIGANDIEKEGTYVWVTGEAFGFSNWAEGEPNNINGVENAATIALNGLWYDTRNDNQLTFVCEYDPEKTNISTCTINLSETAFTYDGNAKKPIVTVKNGVNVLKSGTDYTTDYRNNTKAGTASITVTGIGGYTGTQSKFFTISRTAPTLTFASAAVSKMTTDAAFTNALTKVTDGTVSYSSSNTSVATVNSSTGQVTIKGAGEAIITASAAQGTNYNSGSASYKLTVAPAQNQNKGGSTGGNTGTGGGSTVQAANITAKDITKVCSAKAQSFSLKAKTNSDAKLTYKSSDKKVKIDKSGKVKLPKNYVGKFTVSIKAAVTTKFTSASKKVTVTITPPKATLKSASTPKKGWIKLAWKTVKGVSGYQIVVCESKNFSTGTLKQATISAKKQDVTMSGLKSGKKYFARIRTTKKVGKKTYFGPWSSTKSVKVK